jgi:hypothetical protein
MPKNETITVNKSSNKYPLIYLDTHEGNFFFKRIKLIHIFGANAHKK